MPGASTSRQAASTPWVSIGSNSDTISMRSSTQPSYILRADGQMPAAVQFSQMVQFRVGCHLALAAWSMSGRNPLANECILLLHVCLSEQCTDTWDAIGQIPNRRHRKTHLPVDSTVQKLGRTIASATIRSSRRFDRILSADDANP